MKPDSVELLIVGAGPYGLAIAAAAADRGVDFAVVGSPMALWREHMPKGMILRTSKEEHLDPAGVATMDAFMAARSIPPESMSPLPLSRYLDYVDWFIREKDIPVVNDLVVRLDGTADGFRARMRGGAEIEARKVVVAIGVRDFRNLPPELVRMLPEGRYSHSTDHNDLQRFAGRRVVIVGGRQSAFETAALLAEDGARSVHVVCRHPAPQFTTCDFAFMRDITAAVEADPGWHRKLTDEERTAWKERAFREGREKLEPWLGPRLAAGQVRTLENTELTAARHDPESGDLVLVLSDGSELRCDHVILATGFRADLSRVAFLQAGNLADRIAVRDGFPALDESFQCSVPGLHFMGMASVNDFGFSFGFSTGAPVAARLFLAGIGASETGPTDVALA